MSMKTEFQIAYASALHAADSDEAKAEAAEICTDFLRDWGVYLDEFLRDGSMAESFHLLDLQARADAERLKAIQRALA